MQKVRCAIYTRKSSEDGLEQEFNSLHAQREACAAYIKSQKAEGWVLLPEAYDDGGLSGGTLERPALQRLLAAMDDGRVDRIVVYKIDRLTRSLSDFARIVERLDGAGASFVSVTQSFNTATSMGRLTLNMLLSFAQFEREVTAERIRDKIAASKRKGLWMGGQVPLGYDADGRTLRIREDEASTVRKLYDLYARHGSIRAVKAEADRLGLRSRERRASSGRVTGGIAFDRGHVHHILTNPLYAGRIRHRGAVHDGQHPAIVPPEIWDAVQAQLKSEAARPRGHRKDRATSASPLAGKLLDETGDRLTPTHTRTRSGKRLRYYVSHRLVRRSGERGVDGWRLPAAELEQKIAGIVREHLGSPALAAALGQNGPASATAALHRRLKNVLKVDAGDDDRIDALALIERVDLASGHLSIALDRQRKSHLVGVPPEGIPFEALSIRAPFQTRKRGVETRLILGAGPTAQVDRTLLTNVATGHAWFQRITTGDTYDGIAASAGVSKRRVMQLVELAFLSPEIVGEVLDGRQPPGLTTDLLVKRGFPVDWTEQRRLLDSL